MIELLPPTSIQRRWSNYDLAQQEQEDGWTEMEYSAAAYNLHNWKLARSGTPSHESWNRILTLVAARGD